MPIQLPATTFAPSRTTPRPFPPVFPLIMFLSSALKASLEPSVPMMFPLADWRKTPSLFESAPVPPARGVGADVVALDDVGSYAAALNPHTVAVVPTDDVLRRRYYAADRILRGSVVENHAIAVVRQSETARRVRADVIAGNQILHGG